MVTGCAGGHMKKGWMRHIDFFMVDLFGTILTCIIIEQIYQAKGGTNILLYHNSEVTLVLLQIIAAFMLNSYDGIVDRGWMREFFSCAKQIAAVLVGLFIVIIFISNEEILFRRQFFVISVPNFLCIYFGRMIWKKYLIKRYNKVKYTRQIFVITTKREVEIMAKKIDQMGIRNYKLGGLIIVDEDMKGQMIGSIFVSANKDEIQEYMENQVIDEVFLNIPGNSDYEYNLAKKFLQSGVTVHIYMQQNYESFPNRELGNLFGYDVFSSSIRKISFRELLLKRVVDIAGGIVGVILTGIVGIFVIPCIWIKSPGPAFFSQIRVGQNGRRFKIYKFRSMYLDAEERKKELMAENEGSQLMFKIKDDPRIIKGIGHFIRRTSIDEMPQFWNVLKGDMSLVGTRPPTEEEYKMYEWHHRRRLSIKPGITGMWQISGRSDIKDFEKVVEMDTYYIANYSFELDMKILVETLLQIIKHEGAS